MSPASTLKVREYVHLLVLNLKIKCTDFAEYIRVVFNYYSHPTFFKIDSYLVLSYIFNNPFGISKRFLLNKGDKDLYTYGETPLTTLEHIAQECRLSSRDVVFELGCGRGRTCFWLNQFIGCKVVGIDYVPSFIERANQTKEKFQLNQVEFRQEDLLQTDLTGATIIYLYGTCFSDSFIQTLTSRFDKLPSGTKVITVSYPLVEYAPQANFEVLKRFPAIFAWGAADVYLQIKR